MLWPGTIAAFVLKLPIHAYRWTLKAFFGWHCRHLPTCSEYALDSIDRNGAWRGFWLMLSRLLRCRPWGTAGYDPVLDIRHERHLLTPWRYGRWSGRHLRDDRTAGVRDGQGVAHEAGVAGEPGEPPGKPPGRDDPTARR